MSSTSAQPASVDAISAMVGDTPLIELRYTHEGTLRRLFAKYELMNMTGSVKDRMALHIIRRAYESGDLKPGDVITEASSGNTGISFAAIGRALGHRVRVYMPDWLSQERVLLMHALGAEVIPVSKAQGGFVGSIEMADTYARENEGVFLPHQFECAANVEAHALTTAPEIVRQLGSMSLRPDAFVAGVGTGGTVMGVARGLRERGLSVSVHPLEPANSPTLRTGKRVGMHRIQGISDEFIPDIVCLDQLDEIVDVWDGDAILMAQALCHRLGLAVGISSGANVIGAMKLVEQMGDDAVVVTVLPDSNKKYLSTALTNAEPPHDHYVTPGVCLKGFSAVR